MMVRRSCAAIVVAAILIATGAGPASAGGEAEWPFKVSMFGCPAGAGPAGSKLLITWHNAEGDLKRTRTVTTNDIGSWVMSSSQCSGARVEPGDVLVAESTDGPTQRHGFTVPRITGSGNRATDVVSGVGPRNSSLEVVVKRSPINVLTTQSWGPVTATTSATGAYSLDLTGIAGSTPSYDAIGQDQVTLSWTGPEHDTVSQTYRFPGIVVNIGEPKVTGLTSDFKLSTFTIKNASGVVRGGGPGIADASGSMIAELQRASTAPLRPRAGDTFIGDHTGSAATFAIPTLTVSFDVATDVVSGVCMPNSPYVILIMSSVFMNARGTTDGTGATTPFDTTSFADLQGGDEVLLTCQRPSGDRIARKVAIPLAAAASAAEAGPVTTGGATQPLLFNLTMFGCPIGRGPVDASLRISWHNADGELKRARTVTVGGGGSWFMSSTQCSGVRVEPGDILIAESTSPPLSHTLEVPLITGAGNRGTDVVSGVGPANSSLQINVQRSPIHPFGVQIWGPVTATTSATGAYSLDLTGLPGSPAGTPAYDAIGQDRVTAKWTGPGGDTVTRQSKFPGVVVNIGGPTVTGMSTDFKLSTFSVKNHGSAVRGGGPGIAEGFGSFTAELQKANGAPLRPRAGDTFIGDHTGATVTFVIPTLTISIDVAQDIVSGTCMPNSPYSIRAFVSIGFTTAAGVTDGSGDTTPFDVTSFNDLKSGDRVLLTCQKPSGDRIARTVAIP